MPASEILCVGEVLWDALPAGLFLGGAPFNVACHLRAAGVPVALMSRVGADHLGERPPGPGGTVGGGGAPPPLLLSAPTPPPPYDDRAVVQRSLRRADVV